jgi:hypothetical protein
MTDTTTDTTTDTDTRVRHFCRNPRCRAKMRTPVENPHAAFCCRGCFKQFYGRPQSSTQRRPTYPSPLFEWLGLGIGPGHRAQAH